MQVRITDQAPDQKREGEIWVWGGLGGPARRAPPTLLEGAGQAPPLTACFSPYSLSPLPHQKRRAKQGSFWVVWWWRGRWRELE